MLRCTLSMAALFIVAELLLPVHQLAAQPPNKKQQIEVSNLSLEVTALQTLYHFNFTKEQLKKLRKLAAETAGKATPRTGAKFTPECVKVLKELRAALLEDQPDANTIDSLEDELDQARNGTDIDLDDDVEITTAARQQAPEILRWLSARQVNSYLTNQGDDVPDPLELMLAVLDKSPKLKDGPWKKLAEETVEEVSRLLGGLDKKSVAMVAGQVNQWLKQVRAAKEFAKQRPALEKAAQKLASQVPPTFVLHNIVEVALAELLSNPRLPAVLDARLGQ